MKQIDKLFLHIDNIKNKQNSSAEELSSFIKILSLFKHTDLIDLKALKIKILDERLKSIILKENINAAIHSCSLFLSEKIEELEAESQSFKNVDNDSIVSLLNEQQNSLKAFNTAVKSKNKLNRKITTNQDDTKYLIYKFDESFDKINTNLYNMNEMVELMLSSAENDSFGGDTSKSENCIVKIKNSINEFDEMYKNIINNFNKLTILAPEQKFEKEKNMNQLIDAENNSKEVLDEKNLKINELIEKTQDSKVILATIKESQYTVEELGLLYNSICNIGYKVTRIKTEESKNKIKRFTTLNDKPLINESLIDKTAVFIVSNRADSILVNKEAFKKFISSQINNQKIIDLLGRKNGLYIENKVIPNLKNYKSLIAYEAYLKK